MTLSLTLDPGPQPEAPRAYRGDAATVHSRDDWQTPPSFLAGLRTRWRFVLDAACSRDNAVAPLGIPAELDGLVTPWDPAHGVATGGRGPAQDQGAPAVWCNPPYGRKGELSRAFVARGGQQAVEVCRPLGLDVVMLLGATTDVRWFHEVALHPDVGCDEVWFTKGRLGFVDPSNGKSARNNVTGSVLLVWRATTWLQGPALGSVGKDGLPLGRDGW